MRATFEGQPVAARRSSFMLRNHLDAQARRVVTGVNAEGRSVVVLDEPTPHRLPNPGNTKCDIWRMDSVPTSKDADDALSGVGVVTEPPRTGLVHRVVTFPPDSEWDRRLGYSDSRGVLPTGYADNDDGGIPGLHVTDTVDFLTIISGELVCELEEGEAVLRPGDTMIQRGTRHAWSNRTDDVVVAVSVMVAAE
jgi:mannose-6-phosphate isomerase-like protein (cupin superfamily)